MTTAAPPRPTTTASEDRIAASAVGRIIRAGVYVSSTLAQPDERAPGGELFDLKIIASTGRVARDGGLIQAGAWNRDLTFYLANPVVLWAHTYDVPPIATAVDTRVDKKTGHLVQWWRFHTGLTSDSWDAFCGRVKALYAVGGMRAASVGWLMIDVRRAEREEREDAIARGEREPIWVCTRGELLETSAVPVPADPGALQVDRALREARMKGADIRDLEQAWQTLKRTRSLPATLIEVAAARRSVTPWQGAPDVTALLQREPAEAPTAELPEPPPDSDTEAGDQPDEQPVDEASVDPPTEEGATGEPASPPSGEQPTDATTESAGAETQTATATAVQDSFDEWLAAVGREVGVAMTTPDDRDDAGWTLDDLLAPPRGAAEPNHRNPSALDDAGVLSRQLAAVGLSVDELRQVVREELQAALDRRYLASLGRTR